MEIEIDLKKNQYENAAVYFEKAKKLKKKVERAKKLLEEVKKQLKKLEEEEERRKEIAKEREERKKAKMEEKKEEEEKEEKEAEAGTETSEKKWYEKYRWFYTSNGFLCIGGKNAEQNDEIYYKYFEDRDLFFHANIRGGSAVILKDGLVADEEDKKEAAQFAACYSKAWKEGYASVDVTYAEKKNVKKDNLPKGSFYVYKSKRYKNVELELKIGLMNNKTIVLPARSKVKLEKEIIIVPGDTEKEKIAEELSKEGYDMIELVRIIPAGKSSVKKK